MAYAYLIVTVFPDIYTVNSWTFMGNSSEFYYGYCWGNNGYCYSVTSAEAQEAITGTLSNLTTTAKTNLVSAINELDSDKQDILVSGTSIKTVNNTSLLGSGNINTDTAKNIITANFSADHTISTGDAYVNLPLNASISVGSGLTLNNSGGIVIGTGITKVMTSAKIVLPVGSITASGKNVTITKNGTIVDRNWLAIPSGAPVNTNLVLPSKLIEVQAGDVLKLQYYGKKNDVITGTERFTHFTVEAVEYE
jgi:hypothetical protein